MIEIKMKENNIIKIFKCNINSFAIVDYKTENGTDTAKGKLISVSEEGDIFIVHLKNEKVSWGFKTEQVVSYKFSPIKEEEKNASSY